MEPQLNEVAFNDYWHFINERHRIFLKKEAGEPKPWSDEEAFQNWKFCNPFRVNDKQTRLLMGHVIEPHFDDDPGLLLFNIFLFRAFNLYETYEKLGGWVEHWSPTLTKQKLEDIALDGDTLFSGAYMIRGREGMPKWESIVLTMDAVWDKRNELASHLSNNNRMEDAFKAILRCGFWGWADFTTYQIVLDLTYTKILQDPGDINLWCAFGPGAGRGLNLIYPGIKPKDYLKYSKNLLIIQDRYLEEHVPQMTLQDIEFSLCELQKYTRVKNGGRAKEKYNGKA